jgi:hypothetical protein
MDFAELQAFTPGFLDEVYPGLVVELPPGHPGPWVLQRSGSVSLVLLKNEEPPNIKIKTGVAFDVPLTPQVLLYVATVSKQLWNGRAYLVAGEDKAIVLLEELVFGSALSDDFVPGLQDLASRISTLTSTGGRLSKEVVTQFGGNAFAADDWIYLSV